MTQNVTKSYLRPQRVFKSGSWTGDDGKTYTYTEEQVLSIATSYKPTLRAANFVEGHPKDDQPDYGLVAACFVDADGWLVAVPSDVEQNFATRYNSGEFNGWSISVLPPGHPDNPTDGHYLKHIGAVPKGFQPGVKGQPIQQFCSPSDDGVINFYMEDKKENPVTPPAVDPPTVPSLDPQQFAQLQSELEAQKAELKAQGEAFKKQQAEWTAKVASDRAQNFVEANRTRISGNEIPLVRDVMSTLYIQEAIAPISFTSGDKQVALSDAVGQLIANRQPLYTEGRLELENFTEITDTRAAMEAARQRLNEMHGKNLRGAN
jgi:hypothetical protein